MKRKVMKTIMEEYCDNSLLEISNKVHISLWVLVDSYGRIYYSGSSKEQANEYNQNFLNEKNLKLVELTGIVNE